jgi:hypothetical protein
MRSSLYERIHQLQEKFQSNEDWLQRYIGKHPEVLPMRDLEGIDLRLRLIARELKDIDLLFADERGLLTIVETKLIENPDSRREVVAQVLDYASKLEKMDALALCKEISFQKDKEEAVKDFPEIRDLSKLLYDLIESDLSDSEIAAKKTLAHYVITGRLKRDLSLLDTKESKEKDFLERLDQMLKDGSFRLVIVTYEASSQLIDFVNYTNSKMKRGNQLVVVELSKEPWENPTCFIPHLLGSATRLSSCYYREHRSHDQTEKEWDKELFFDSLSKNAPDLVNDLRTLLSEIERAENSFSYDFRTGGVFAAIRIWLELPGKERYHVMSIRTDGSVILYFHPYKNQEIRLWTPSQEAWAIKVISSRPCLEKAGQEIEKTIGRNKDAYHSVQLPIDIRNCESEGERWKFLVDFMKAFRNVLISSE